MEKTFADGNEKIVESDFVMVRNSVGRMVFMGERKNIKCFDRLKKVSERVFETLAGHTYKFLDKIPEPKQEIKVTQEMRARAEAALNLFNMLKDAGIRASIPTVPQRTTPEPKPMTPEEKWKTNATLRAEFMNNFNSYLAYLKAVESGRTKVCGVS